MPPRIVRPHAIQNLAAPCQLEQRRRLLQLSLALLWLLDAALQFQPFMFGRGFATQVIEPTARGNPAPLAHPILWSAHLLAAHPILWNTLFASAQLGLALGMLRRSTVKLALAASIAWSLGVWWLGEGLGGILAGTANPLTGAPGAVILYALLALLAWPTSPRGASIAAGSVLQRGANAPWLALWGGAAYLALQPANASHTAWRATFADAAPGEPRWLAFLDRWVAATVAHHGTPITFAFAALLAVAAIAPLSPPAIARPLLAVTILASTAIWVLAENLGGILTGHATDPNTGLPLILIALAYWPIRGPQSFIPCRTRTATAA